MDFKTRLKELRESKGLTQKELADKLNELCESNIYTQTVSYWENGREPSFGILIKLSQFFNVPIDYLLGNSDKLDLNEINFEKSLKNFNTDNINKVISNLTKELKSSFFNIVYSHLDTLGISNELHLGTPLSDSTLDYMYLISKFDELISDFDNSIIDIFVILHDNDNFDITVLDKLDKTRVSKLSELMTNTTYQFSLILNEFIQMRIESLGNNNYKSKYIEKLK